MLDIFTSGRKVTGRGSGISSHYEYKLNNGYWTYDSVRTNLKSGTHTITVRDVFFPNFMVSKTFTIANPPDQVPALMLESEQGRFKLTFTHNLKNTTRFIARISTDTVCGPFERLQLPTLQLQTYFTVPDAALRYVSVIAENEFGESKPSLWLPFSRDDVAPLAPINFLASYAGTNLNTKWSPGGNNHSRFKVQISRDSTFQTIASTADLERNATAWTFQDRNENYWVRVQAYNSHGASPWVKMFVAVPASNTWKPIHNVSYANGKLTFTNDNRGGYVRIDVTSNLNADADPPDPTSPPHNWGYYTTIDGPAQPGQQSISYSLDKPTKIRFLVWGDGKQPSMWVTYSWNGTTLSKPVMTAVRNETGGSVFAHVSWSDPNPSPKVYIIERKKDDADWIAIVTNYDEKISSLSSSFDNASTLSFRMRTNVTGVGLSPYSEPVTVQKNVAVDPKSPVVNLASSNTNLAAQTITVSFQNATSVTDSVRLYRAAANGEFQLVSTTYGSTAIVQTGLSSDLYRYKAQQKTTGGWTAFGAEASIRFFKLAAPRIEYSSSTQSASLSITNYPSNFSDSLRIEYQKPGATGWSCVNSSCFGSSGLPNPIPTTQGIFRVRIQVKKHGHVSQHTEICLSITGSNGVSVSNECVADLTNYPYETKAKYASGTYSPWVKFGKFQSSSLPYGSQLDLIGGRQMPWAFTDTTDRITNLGFSSTGIYAPGNIAYGQWENDFLIREKEPIRRYLYACQACYEAIHPPLAAEYFADNAPYNLGQPFRLDNGTTRTVSPAQWPESRKGNIVYAYYHRHIIGSNLNYGTVRYNAEGYSPLSNYDYYLDGRYSWQNGKYLPARAGGTDYTTSDGDPAYAYMSDAEWNQHVFDCQIKFDLWHSIEGVLNAKPNFRWNKYGLGTGTEYAIMNGKKGLIQMGYWSKYYNNKRLKDVISTPHLGWLDVIIRAVPFQIEDPAEMEGQWPAVVKLGLAENSVHTGITVPGNAEFYRFEHDNSNAGCPEHYHKHTIWFEDQYGNSQITEKAYRIASIDTRDWTSTLRYDIPKGVTHHSWCHPGFPEKWVHDLQLTADDELIRHYFYYPLNYLLDSAHAASYQAYMSLSGFRYIINPEVQVAGQLPRNLVTGLRMLGSVFKVGTFWYNWNDLTFENVVAANKRIHAYNSHFDGREIPLEVEISLDQGKTWTVSGQIDRQNDFASYRTGAYSADWITARKEQKLASPLVVFSYHPVKKSYVIFEKAVYGNSLNYSFRVKYPDGNVQHFNNRVLTRDWKDAGGVAGGEPSGEPGETCKGNACGSIVEKLQLTTEAVAGQPHMLRVRILNPAPGLRQYDWSIYQGTQFINFQWDTKTPDASFVIDLDAKSVPSGTFTLFVEDYPSKSNQGNINFTYTKKIIPPAVTLTGNDVAGKVQLSWNSAGSGITYVLDTKVDNSSWFSQNLTATSITIDYTPGQKHYYRVRYTLNGTDAPASNIVELVKPAQPMPAPILTGQPFNYWFTFPHQNQVTGYNSDRKIDNGPWIRYYENREPMNSCNTCEKNAFLNFSDVNTMPQDKVYRYRYQEVNSATGATSPWSNVMWISNKPGEGQRNGFEPADQTATGTANYNQKSGSLRGASFLSN